MATYSRHDTAALNAVGRGTRLTLKQRLHLLRNSIQKKQEAKKKDQSSSDAGLLNGVTLELQPR